jgi:hypothetical protein
VAEAYPDLALWVGCVAYRDHCDGAKRVEVFPFNASVEAFEAYMARVSVQGGGDGPEDIHGGLEEAVRCGKVGMLGGDLTLRQQVITWLMLDWWTGRRESYRCSRVDPLGLARPAGLDGRSLRWPSRGWRASSLVSWSAVPVSSSRTCWQAELGGPRLQHHTRPHAHRGLPLPRHGLPRRHGR